MLDIPPSISRMQTKAILTAGATDPNLYHDPDLELFEVGETTLQEEEHKLWAEEDLISTINPPMS